MARTANKEDLVWFDVNHYDIDELHVSQITNAIAIRKNIVELIKSKKPLIPSLKRIAKFYSNEKSMVDRVHFSAFNERELAIFGIMHEIFNMKNPFLSFILPESSDAVVSKTENSLFSTKTVTPISVNTVFSLFNHLKEQSEIDYNSFKNKSLEADSGRKWFLDADLTSRNWGLAWYNQRYDESVNSVINEFCDNNLFLSIDLNSSDDEIIKNISLLLPKLRDQLSRQQDEDSIDRRFGVVSFLDIKKYSLIAVLDLIIFNYLHDYLNVSDSVIERAIYENNKENYRDSYMIKKKDRPTALRLIEDDFLLKLHHLINNDKLFESDPVFSELLKRYNKKYGI